MKKMIVSAIMLTAFAATANAQDAKTAPAATGAVATASAQESKTKIDPAGLPDAVKTALSSGEYKDWTIVTAWSVKAEPVYYTLELKKEDKTVVVNMTSDGKVR